MPEPLPAPPALETLRADAAFLRHYLANYVVHVPVKDAHDKVVNGFTAVQIPDWAVKQRLDDIDAAIVRASAAPDLLDALKMLTPSWRAPGCWCSIGRDIENFGHEPGCIAASAAIAKAEGREVAHAS